MTKAKLIESAGKFVAVLERSQLFSAVQFEAVKKLVRDADQAGKIIGVICHAGWVPISAGIMNGRRATGSTAIKDDIENAGGIWVDAAAFRDGNLVWGRVVEDIPDFCRELVAAIEGG